MIKCIKIVQAASNWGDVNLLRFNAQNTRVFVFHKTEPNTPGSDLPRCIRVVPYSLQLLGVELSSNINFGQYIESKAQIAA